MKRAPGNLPGARFHLAAALRNGLPPAAPLRGPM